MKSLAWQILCYTLFCKSDEQVSPWESVSGLLSLHSEQDPNPRTRQKHNKNDFKLKIPLSLSGLKNYANNVKHYQRF